MLLTAVVVAAVLWLTLGRMPDTEGVPLPLHADKVVHLIMFFGVAYTGAVDYMSHFGFKPGRKFIIAAVWAVMSALLGGAIELLQDAMEMGRSGDWADFAADAIGAALAIPAALFTARQLR